MLYCTTHSHTEVPEKEWDSGLVAPQGDVAGFERLFGNLGSSSDATGADQRN